MAERKTWRRLFPASKYGPLTIEFGDEPLDYRVGPGKGKWVPPPGFTFVPHDTKAKIITIGTGCRIRPGATVFYGVKIGDRTKTGHNVFIREACVIGTDCLIGTGSIIENDVRIGNGTRIQSAVYLPTGTRIGNGVFIGPMTVFTNDRYMDYGKRDLKAPVVEDDVRIGANCTILPGVRLRKGCWIGAGSVVTKDTEPSWIYAGNPAVKLRKTSEVAL